MNNMWRNAMKGILSQLARPAQAVQLVRFWP